MVTKIQLDICNSFYDIIILLATIEEENEMEKRHKSQFIEADVLDVNLVYKDQNDVQFACILVDLIGIYSINDLNKRFKISAIFDVEFIDHSGEIEILECRKVQSSKVLCLLEQSSEQISEISDISDEIDSDEDLWLETKELIKDLLIVAIREEMLKN